MSVEKIVIQQQQTDGSYNELWPKTNSYTKEESNQLYDYKIGDIKCTTREKSLNWLECNGKSIDGEEYPELTSILGDIGPSMNIQNLSVLEGENLIANTPPLSCYGDGKWVVAYLVDSNDRGILRIKYSSSLNGPWTTKDIWTSYSPAYYCVLNSLTFGNGYWVIAGAISNSSKSKWKAVYSTDLINWENFSWRDGTQRSIGMQFSEGKFACVGQYPYNGYYTALFDSPVSERTMVDVGAGSSHGRNREGQLQALYNNGYIWSIRSQYPSVRYQNSTMSSGNEVAIWNDGYTGTSHTVLYSQAYGDGYYVVGGIKYDTEVSFYGAIAYSTSFSGSWKVVKVFDSAVILIKKIDTGWLAASKKGEIALSRDLKTWDFRLSSNGEYYSMAYKNKQENLLSGLIVSQNTSSLCNSEIFSSGAVLPNITTDKSKNYIKAK